VYVGTRLRIYRDRKRRPPDCNGFVTSDGQFSQRRCVERTISRCWAGYRNTQESEPNFSPIGLISERPGNAPVVTSLVFQAVEEAQLSVDTSRQHLSPFVKWAGGKTSLLPHLLPNVPRQLSDYYEPFLGAGALFLGICARTTSFNAHLSDINEELITTYKVIKQSPEELIRLLSRFQREYDSTLDKSAYFYRKRSWRPVDWIESTARLIFLNKTCYNGLYRVNSKGEFNVPFGRYKNPRILNSDNILAVSQVLQDTKAELRSIHYKEALASCGKSDFVYLDPPYQPPSKTSSFTDYTPGGFSQKDQEELAEEFEKLVDRGCTVLLTNSETSLTRHLYREFEVRKVTVNRPINSVGTGRKGYRELIVVGHPR
jgi:DNA adenine methylase